MSWFTDIFSGGVSKVVDSVGTAIDKLVTSDEERLQLKNALQKAMNDYNLEVEKVINQREKEITERWKSDNEHFITRLVRPVSFAWVIVLFSAVMLSDGNIGNFQINASYIPVLETLLTTMTIAYFGARTFDKHSKNKSKGK